jgi:hypothetical protein
MGKALHRPYYKNSCVSILPAALRLMMGKAFAYTGIEAGIDCIILEQHLCGSVWECVGVCVL